MYIFRFLGGIFALVIIFVASLFSKIELTDLMAIVSFMFTVDILICKFISYVYMKAIYKQLEDIERDK